MTHVLALTFREIAERKLLLVGSGAMGLMVLLAPLLRGTGSYTYLDVADLAALIVVTSVYVGGCVVLGATVIGRDLSSGKLSFFLTRPLGTAEIWTGRMLGAFLTALLSALLAAIPVTLAGGGLRHLFEPTPGGGDLPSMLAVPLVLLLAAHYVGVAFRSRSVVLLLDIVALCVASGMFWTLALPFLPSWFGRPQSLGAFCALLALFLAVSGWAGLANGRITPVAVHRWSAATLWSLVAVALLSFASWRAWVFAVSPHEIDLSKGWAHEIDGNGEWIGIGSGEKKGRGGIQHEFLMSTKTGAWMRVDDISGIAVSADRRVAVIAKRSWVWRPPKWFETTIQTVDLTAAKPRARDTGIVLNEGLWETPALSADGSRIAVRESGNVAVYSLEDEKLLAAFPHDEAGWPIISFSDNGRLLVISTEEKVTVISTFDIARRERVSRNVFTGTRLRLDRTGSRVAIGSGTEDKRSVVSIYETRSGVKLGEIPFQGAVWGRRAHWLSDGGLASATIDATPLRKDHAGEIAESSISVHAVDGTERLRVPLPGAQRILIAGEQREGELIVVWADNSNLQTPCAGEPHVVAIDLASGALRKLPIEGWAAAYSWRTSTGPGSASSRLFSTCDGKMVMFDAATGEKRTLLGGR